MGRLLVTLDRVDVRLAGAVVLAGVSLEIRAGEGLAVVGPSGSGKSTLLRLVRGDLWPHPSSAGRRLYHAEDGASESPIGARERFALVAPEAQDAYVRHDWDLPVEAVIRSGFFDAVFPAEAATPAQRTRIVEVATLLGVTHLLARSILELSRGEGRRVLLARALAPGPDLLLLDEACDGLDAPSREAFLEHVRAVLRGGTAVVLATHREEEIPPEIRARAKVEGGTVRIEALDAGVDLEPGDDDRARRQVGGRARARTRDHDHDHDHDRDHDHDHDHNRDHGHDRDLDRVRIGGHDRARDLDPPAAGGDRDLDRDARPRLFDLDRVTVRVEGRDVLSSLEFVLHAGERVAVVGPNGAGKSTFLRLLAGEEQPASGTIRRLGLGERAGAFELRGRIGVVSPELQARHRFDATGETVVLSGFDGAIGLAGEPTAAGRARAADAMARLGVSHLASRHLLSLSYGELRKLLVARALAPDPAVLLLDEPLAGLDTASREWVKRTVAAACDAGAALVTVTHHADELPAGIERLLALSGGRLVSTAPSR